MCESHLCLVTKPHPTGPGMLTDIMLNLGTSNPQAVTEETRNSPKFNILSIYLNTHKLLLPFDESNVIGVQQLTQIYWRKLS
jgi:hypothetical protein